MYSHSHPKLDTVLREREKVQKLPVINSIVLFYFVDHIDYDVLEKKGSSGDLVVNYCTQNDKHLIHIESYLEQQIHALKRDCRVECVLESTSSVGIRKFSRVFQRILNFSSLSSSL